MDYLFLDDLPFPAHRQFCKVNEAGERVGLNSNILLVSVRFGSDSSGMVK